MGSHTLEFWPRLRPSQFSESRIDISADTPAASALLILQAVFPFLLFACGGGGGGKVARERGAKEGEKKDEELPPIEIELSGGTNVSWSLSWEYLDQVLLPMLKYLFGIQVERAIRSRGWSAGPPSRGKVYLMIRPLRAADTLRPRIKGRISRAGGEESANFGIEAIDVSVIAPSRLLEELQNKIFQDLEILFPGVDARLKGAEESGADSRLYVFLVAHSGNLRWGRDILSSSAVSKKNKGNKKSKGGDDISDKVSRRVCRDLYQEVSRGGVVDEFLQDQLVIFQALAEGETSFPGPEERESEAEKQSDLEQDMAHLELGPRRRKDKTEEPFGEGSLHTTTARWVAAQLLPNVAWYNKGRICAGGGIRMEEQRDGDSKASF